MREWLTVIIVLLIIGVLLDGWRRMRLSKRQAIKMSRNISKTDEGIPETYGSELPNGGARVVGVRDEDDTRELTRNLQQDFERSKTTLGRRKIPEQVTLNLDEEVPMLMESVTEDERLRKEPSIAEIAIEEPSLDERLPEPATAAEETARSATKAERAESRSKAHQDSEPEQEPEVEEVLVINVMSTGGERFQGADLLQVLLQCGMRFGDMQIFHRHEGEDGEGDLLFSMVNMVVPGTFELSTMSEFETPGVSFFMTLPMSANSMEAFNIMANTAMTLADSLGGELKDEQRSIMTQQTIEHCRQRIREFERKQLSRV